MNAPAEPGATTVPHRAGSLTILQGAALYIGAVLGTGVIALPALAAEVAGPASLLAWAALVMLSIPLAATFAALGARYPDAGGVSTYVRKAFGPKAAAVVGWCFYFAVPAGAPAAAMFGGAYVAAVTGGAHATMIASAAVLIALVAAANAFGVTVSGRMQLVLSALLVALLVAAVLASAPHARAANLHPFAPHGWLAVGEAAALLVWSFAGWEAITHLAAEFRRPARDLPRSTGIAVAVVGLLYLSVAAASVLVLGPAAGESGAPLAALIARGIGGNAQLIATAAALLLTLGTMNAYFAGAAKLGAAPLVRAGQPDGRRAAAQPRRRRRARRLRARRGRRDGHGTEAARARDIGQFRDGLRARRGGGHEAPAARRARASRIDRRAAVGAPAARDDGLVSAVAAAADRVGNRLSFHHGQAGGGEAVRRPAAVRSGPPSCREMRRCRTAVNAPVPRRLRIAESQRRRADRAAFRVDLAPTLRRR
ncbi:amino acid permease family protein [Burkholderia pseudomallei]|nr:amino acid permease family protein [Burkholderia pseudomallei]